MNRHSSSKQTNWATARVWQVSAQGLVLDLRPAERGKPVERVYFTHATLLDFLTMVERQRSPEPQPAPDHDPEQQRLPW